MIRYKVYHLKDPDDAGNVCAVVDTKRLTVLHYCKSWTDAETRASIANKRGENEEEEDSLEELDFD